MVEALAGRTAVVTGAGRGIGRAIAVALAAAGADIVATSRHPDQLASVADEVTSLGRQAVTVDMDLARPAQVDALAATVLRTGGRVDILVNNAGEAGPAAPLWEVDPHQWHQTLDVNVTGAYLCCRALIPIMIAGGRGGSIVFVGSVTGKRPLLHRSAYATSKMALVGLCRTLALDGGPYRIRSNLVSPGFVEGDRMDWVLARQGEAQRRHPDQVRADLTAQAALGRLVSASEVADAVVFLAGDGAGAITGIDLTVAAGSVMY